MNSNKEEQILIKRINELANIADRRYISTYSDFLNLNEQAIFYNTIKELPKINYNLYGGFSNAERKILCFYNDEYSFPISCIHIKPKNLKFSADLSHRDYLGALISLGVDRSKMGDILIIEQEAFLFCHTTIKEFIINNLEQIKHTNVTATNFEIEDFIYEPKYKEISGSISSIRLDRILSIAFNISRNKLTDYISSGKVFVNGRNILNNDFVLKDKDIVSVRGIGKFAYQGVSHTTKKGRLSIKIHLYI